MDYSFLAAGLSFTFIDTCIFFAWQINSAADDDNDDDDVVLRLALTCSTVRMFLPEINQNFSGAQDKFWPDSLPGATRESNLGFLC